MWFRVKERGAHSPRERDDAWWHGPGSSAALRGQTLEREEVGRERDARVRGDVLSGDEAGGGGAVELPVDREGDGAAHPAPVLPGRNADDVGADRRVRADELPLPVVLRAVAPEVDVLVEAQQELSVEVVRVLRYRLDHPVRAANEDLLHGTPGERAGARARRSRSSRAARRRDSAS